MCTPVCRVCLVDNVKMFYIQNDHLEVFEKLTSAKLNSVDVPQSVCYICQSLLQRCHRFSERARRSEQILMDMLNNSIEVSQQNVFTLGLGVKDYKIIDLSAGPMYLTTVNSCETVETPAVTVKEEPLYIKVENTLSEIELLIEEIPKHEYIDEEITNVIITNDSVSTVDKESKKMTQVISSFKEENFIEEGTIHKDIVGEVSEHIHQTSLKKRTAKKQTKINLYLCTYCSSTFRNTKSLISHIKLTHKHSEKVNKSIQGYDFVEKNHTKEKPFHCKQCKYSFSKKSMLATHIRTHTGEKPYTCEHCGRSFTGRCNLVKHIRTHTKEKPYACLHCDRRFPDRSQLVVHIRTHTGEKPYSCTQCDKTFSQCTSLTLHNRVHTGEKPFACPRCDFRCAGKSGLVRHVRTHTGEKLYNCKQCNKKFPDNSQLARHNRIHTGEKPYTCELCQKSCSQKSDLVIHMRTHTGEKPYTCSQCNKTFPTSSYLAKHKKKTHTGKKL